MLEPDATVWAERLLLLGLRVQSRLVGLLHDPNISHASLSQPVREAAGDRIYALDDAVESLIVEDIAAWSADCLPLLLVAEGIGAEGLTRFGDLNQPLKFRVLIDPIDGTRMLMSDKRSAWFLAAVARDRGEATSLADTFASVMVELPPSKQTQADCFSAIRGGGVRGRRVTVAADAEPAPLLESAREIVVQPSHRTDLRDGFMTVVSYFPDIKVLAAELVERIAAAVPRTSDSPDVFDDQYISTGGQLVQLMTGRDRCCLDLRPLFARMRRATEHVMPAHPYDLAGLLVAQEAGVVLTNGLGQPLDAPLDVSTGVAWCGYANSSLREFVEPIVQQWLRERLPS